MGKSLKEKFKSSGGQNPLEAVKLGCRVYHGPYISNLRIYLVNCVIIKLVKR